jgi:beta-1,4-mannosyltransferase
MLLAGGTTAEAMAEIEAAMPGNVTVHRRHGQLTDEEVVTWASACDLFALPYTRILNSGSMLLAASLGVPCVVPGEPHLIAEYGDEEWVEFFDIDATSRVDALAEAIERGLDRQGGARAQAAEQFAASYTMHDMSVDFAELLPR